MTQSKNTKKSLYASVVALLLCFVMLIGTTFAWFTDSASTGVNTITAGNLNIDVLVKNVNEVEYKSIKGDTKTVLFGSDILWEPGYVAAKHIKVETSGNLALKYSLKINHVGEVGTLAKVIDVYYAASQVDLAGREDLVKLNKIGTLEDILNDKVGTIEDTLTPGKNTVDFATLVLKMQESAGNEYKGATAGEFILEVNATQNTVESDSFDNQYDKNAFIPGTVVTEETAKEALDAGGVVDFNDTEMFNELIGDNNYGANLREYTFKAGTTVKNLTLKGNSGATRWLHTEGDVTFENCVFEAGAVYAAHFDSGEGTITFKNCEFYGWSSFGRTFDKVVFENCIFDEALKENSWGLLRFYCDGVIKNCTFLDGFDRIDNAAAGITITIDDSTGIEGKMFCNGNPATLGATWIVDGVDISSTIE